MQHLYTSSKYPMGYWLNHIPGSSSASQPFCWRIAYTQSKPPLLESISSCLISFYLGEETPKPAQDSWAAALEQLLGQSQSTSQTCPPRAAQGGSRAGSQAELQAAAVLSPSKLQPPPGSLPEQTEGQKLTAEHASLEEKRKKHLFSCVSSVWEWFINFFSVVITLFYLNR